MAFREVKSGDWPAFLKDGLDKNHFYEENGSIFYFHPPIEGLSGIDVEKNLKRLGAEIANLINGEWIPTHGLAISGFWSDFTDLPSIDLEINEAIEYLRGNVLQGRTTIEGSEYKGYVLLSNNGAPLGLGKSIGTRINNLYPKYLRIKMR